MSTAIRTAIDTVKDVLGKDITVTGEKSFRLPLWKKISDYSMYLLNINGIKVHEEYDPQEDELFGKHYTMHRYYYHIL